MFTLLFFTRPFPPLVQRLLSFMFDLSKPKSTNITQNIFPFSSKAFVVDMFREHMCREHMCRDHMCREHVVNMCREHMCREG